MCWLFLRSARALFGLPARIQRLPLTSGGRKALYYTCAMHPWVRESKPGPCPVCGMNLTPVYANENGIAGDQFQTASGDGHARTGKHQHDQRANGNGGTPSRAPHIASLGRDCRKFVNERHGLNSPLTNAICNGSKAGQTFNVIVPSVPDKTYHGANQTTWHKAICGRRFRHDDAAARQCARKFPIRRSKPATLGKYKLFNSLHAEAHLVAETEAVLAIPRSAIISRGTWRDGLCGQRRWPLRAARNCSLAASAMNSPKSSPV